MKYFFIVILIIILLIFIICAFIFNQLVMRKTFKVPNFIMKFIKGNEMPDTYDSDAEKARERLSKIPSETVTLKTEDGASLKGTVIIPPISNGKVIIACHGARSSGKGEFCFFAPDYARNGYTLIMPDHRGCGESDGNHMGYGTHESRDTFLWLNYAKEHFPNDDIYLLGVSMGGATVLMMSSDERVKGVRGIIADCSYTSAWDEFEYQLGASFRLPKFPLLYICELYNRIVNKYSFKEASPINCVKQARVPILFIHGDKDDFVPTYMQGLLYEECASEKFMLTVPGAVHARSYYTNPEMYTQAVEKFISLTASDTGKI